MLKVTYFNAIRPKKKIRFADEEDKKLCSKCRKYFTTSDCFWTCLPSFLVILFIIATILGIVLALQLNSILHTETTTMSLVVNQTGTSITNANTTTTSSVLTMQAFCANWTWSTTGITVAGTGSSGSGLNELSHPWNIYIDPKTDHLYIADSQNHRIVKWLPNAISGTVIAGKGTSGSSSNELNEPKDVFVDLFQNVYVADTKNQRIQYFSSGNLTATTVSNSWNLGNIYGIYMYNQAIYACDYTNSVIWKNGTAIAGLQGSGSNLNQLNEPQGFTVDTTYNVDTIYIANSKQHTVVKWLSGATTGIIVAGINGIANNTDTTLNFPLTVKTDMFSNLFIVDNNNHRIQLYCQYPSISGHGRTIAGQTGVLGSLSTHLNYPAGVALDSQLNLYVSDTANHRIQKFTRLS